MEPVNFGDTWSQKTNPHPGALRLKGLAGKRCIIWEAEHIHFDYRSRWYLLIGESERDAVWYVDGGELEYDHGNHVNHELYKGNKPVIATLRKRWLSGLYLE